MVQKNFVIRKFSPTQADFLREIIQMGSVLELCLFEYNSSENIYELCKEVAVAGMRDFQKSHGEWVNKLNPDIRKDIFRIKIDGNVQPLGTLISFDEFIGNGYDPDTGKVRLFKYGDDFKSKYSLSDEGLVKALLNPPYSISLPELRNRNWDREYEEIEADGFGKILRRFIQVILNSELNDPADQLVIYKWSDDWSNYFNAGKEWWGTFYWTILNKNDKTITVIAASSTD